MVVVPPENQILLNVFAPPSNVTPVADVSVTLMVDVFALSVRPVVVAMPHTVPVPESVQVPEPMVIVLVPVFEEESEAMLMFWLPASNVPAVTVSDPMIVSAAPLVHAAVPATEAFPPMEVTTVVAVADPAIVKSPFTVVMPVIVFAPEPESPSPLYVCAVPPAGSITVCAPLFV